MLVSSGARSQCRFALARSRVATVIDRDREKRERCMQLHSACYVVCYADPCVGVPEGLSSECRRLFAQSCRNQRQRGISFMLDPATSPFAKAPTAQTKLTDVPFQ